MADRLDELVSALATKLGPELRKCSVEPEPDASRIGCPFMRRAKKAFIEAVEMHAGENSEVSRLAGCTEGNIRLQRRHPDRSPTLQVAYSMKPEAMRRIARDLLAAADEKEGLRRAG